MSLLEGLHRLRLADSDQRDLVPASAAAVARSLNL